MDRGELPSADDDGRRRARRRIIRRLLTFYLVAYYLVVAGAVTTIWHSGLIVHFDQTWTVLAIAFSVLLGVVLAVLIRK